jgi:hypothetical protein
VLGAVRAREQPGLGHHHIRLVLECVAHCGHVDVVGDVPAAVADVHPDAPLLADTGVGLHADAGHRLHTGISACLLAHTRF